MVTRRKTKTKSRLSAKKSTAKKSSAKKATKATKATKARTTKAPSKPGGALRLTFAYDGNDVKLVSQEHVDMIVPPSDSLKNYQNQKGFWAELKNESDKTLYRQVMHNPTRNDAEVFLEDEETSVSKEPAPKRKGVFVVVVPDKGEEVTLSRSTPEKKGPLRGIRSLASKPAKEIMRFKLKKT